MPNFKKLIDKQVTKAFDSLLEPGGLTEDVTFRFFASEGVYDPILDTVSTTYNDVEDVSVIVAKATEDDTKDHDVIATDAKLILPGSKLPSKPETDTDKVVRANGQTWDVRKTVEVPGGGVYLVFIYRT